MRKNREEDQRTKKHNRLKRGGGDRKGQPEPQQAENMEEDKKQATVVTACGKKAERDHKDDPKLHHAESENQRGKTRGSK